jgi:hypothetical protein
MWFKNHIVPKWGNSALSELQARPVEIWLTSLKLSPKSRSHIRSLISTLWDFAMWRGDVPTQRNPMELVTIKGATKRTRKPRSLTVDEFQLSPRMEKRGFLNERRFQNESSASSPERSGGCLLR